MTLLSTNPRIGFVVENADVYDKAMASTRLRCYDVLEYLSSVGISAELFNPSRKYDLVIFQKCFTEQHAELALALRSQGTVVALDININVIDQYGNAPGFDAQELERFKTQFHLVTRMLAAVDHVLVSSPHLADVYGTHHRSVFCIEEMIHPQFFSKTKSHSSSSENYLIYVGYAKKAIEVCLISDVLIQLHREHGVKLLLICETDPKLNIIPYSFVEYNQSLLHEQLLFGDIKIAPRSLDNSYNFGHSYTKVGYPLALGIPAVASPIPSYLNRGVLLCYTERDWYNTLKKLIESPSLRNYFGKRGQAVARLNFSREKIGYDYVQWLEFVFSTKL